MSREVELWRAVAMAQAALVIALGIAAVTAAQRVDVALANARDLNARNAELAQQRDRALGQARACAGEQRRLVDAALEMSRRCGWRAAAWESADAR